MEYNTEYVHFEPTDDMLDKWCIAKDSVYDIKNTLAADDGSIKKHLVQIKDTDDISGFPFKTTGNEYDDASSWKFVYIDPAFQGIKREVYIGICTDGGLTYSIDSNKFKHAYYTTTDIEDAREWIAKRRRFEDIMGAWEDGAAIEARRSGTEWFPVTDPTWDPDVDYRIKPDAKVLEWTDLKIGDIVRSKTNRNIYMQVQGIDKNENTSEHIFFSDDWKSDDDLADWEKVEG